MQGIADSPAHFFIACKLSNLCICGNTTLWNPFYSLIYEPGRIIGDKVIAVCNHVFYSVIRHAAIENDGIPVVLVLVPSGDDGWEGIPPEVSPGRRYLDI